MKQILKKYYAQVSRIIDITLGKCQVYQARLIGLSLVGLLYLCIEAVVLLGIFIIAILTLFLGCAITDSCYAFQNVAATSYEWGVQ